MKKLLFALMSIALLSQYHVVIKSISQVDGTDVVENECSGEWCSPVELSTEFKNKYPSHDTCYYFAGPQDKIKCKGNKSINVQTSDSLVLTSKNYIGTYIEQIGPDKKKVQKYLYEVDQSKSKSKK